MLARSGDAFCRSRHFFHAASVKISPNFFDNGTQPPAFVEIFINFPVPRRAISLPNERDQLSQFFWREPTNSSFDLGQAHLAILIPEATCCNAAETFATCVPPNDVDL